MWPDWQVHAAKKSEARQPGTFRLLFAATACRLSAECPLSESRTDNSGDIVQLESLDTPLSHGLRKRFRQDCGAEEFASISHAVTKVWTTNADDFANGMISLT
jgi:hypothetical protein